MGVKFEKIEKNIIHPRSQKLFRIHHFQRRKGQHNEWCIFPSDHKNHDNSSQNLRNLKTFCKSLIDINSNYQKSRFVTILRRQTFYKAALPAHTNVSRQNRP